MEPETPAKPSCQSISVSPKKDYGLAVILSFFLLLATAIAALLVWQNQKLAKELAKYQAQSSPQPSEQLATPTPDPTANWKTFSDEEAGFSLKYPNAWNNPIKNLQSTRVTYNFTPGNLVITIGLNYNQILQRPRTYEEEVAEEEKNSQGKRSILIRNSLVTIYVNKIGESTTEETVLLKGSESNIIWVTMSFPPGTDITIFDQILSTFKFTNQSSATISLTLPVQVLKTGYGIGPEGYVYPYPKTTTAKVPQIFSDQLAAYGVANQVIVGPKDWAGQGNVGADGGEHAILKPPKPQTNPGPYLLYNDDSVCFGCAVGDGYAFFPQAKSEYDKNFPDSVDLLNLPKIVSTTQITPKLVAYQLVNTSDNLEVNGVAFFEDINGSTSFRKLEIALPSDKHSLATVILNNFISQFQLDKK